MTNQLSHFNMKKTGTEIEIVDAGARSKNEEQDIEIEANANAIAKEVTDRENADNSLNDAITAETTNRENADNSLNDAITAETDRATKAEQDNAQNITTLSNGLQSEIERAEKAESTNADAIKTETEARTSADNVINQKLTQTDENVTANTNAIATKAEKSETVSDVSLINTDGTVTIKQTKDGTTTDVGSFTTGSGGTTAGAVTDVTLTNENGVYTINQTKDGTTTEVGTIETSKSNNPVVEVKDSVVENNTRGYDFHTVKETTEDGTENEVGKWYLAQKQFTKIEAIRTNTLSVTTVNQEGTENTNQLQGYTVVSKSFADIQIPEDITENPFNYRLRVKVGTAYHDYFDLLINYDDGDDLYYTGVATPEGFSIVSAPFNSDGSRIYVSVCVDNSLWEENVDYIQSVEIVKVVPTVTTATDGGLIITH